MYDKGLGVELPPHARIVGLTFDDNKRTLLAKLERLADRDVSANRIRALYGARILHEVFRAPGRPGENFARDLLTASTWPRSLRPHTTMAAPPGEESQFAIAMRVYDVDELWYLIADSFNFRKALGANASYATEMNLRTLVRRLATFSPDALQDAFIAAVINGRPLPPPLPSLAKFFWVTVKARITR